MILPVTAGRWQVERVRATAGEVHARELPDPVVPAVWVVEATTPAVVLGSTQPDEVVDRGRARALGYEVVRRRSGGGAVVVEPGAVLWVDVLVPRGDPRWSDDVGVATHWLGRLWASALAAAGHDAHVHEGAMEAGELGRLVCFAGRGPGEVFTGGDGAEAKTVGISQRRTRAAARFQCACLLRWDPAPLAELLVDIDDAALLADAGRGVGPVGDAVLAALIAAFEAA